MVSDGATTTLNGGAGSDTFVYNAVSDSTSLWFDTITDFDGASDKIDTWFNVKSADSTIIHGRLDWDNKRFDSELQTEIGLNLSPHGAVLFKANSGSLYGDIFLIIDANSKAGYQGGADLVIQLASPTNLSKLSLATFT